MRKATRFVALFLSLSLTLAAAGCSTTSSGEASAEAVSISAEEAASAVPVNEGASEAAEAADTEAADAADSAFEVTAEATTEDATVSPLDIMGPGPVKIPEEAVEVTDEEIAADAAAAADTASAEETAAAADDTATTDKVDVMDSSDFVVLSDVCPDIIQEIRYYSTYNFVGDRIDGYEEPVALMTSEAAKALADASALLMEQGYRLKIYDAYRPQKAVDNFVEWAKDLDDTRMKAYFYPEVDKENLFSDGYIDAKSGHSRGSTVDLTIVDMTTGKEVDMGGTFDHFGIESHPSYTGDLTDEQLANRLILRDAMITSGFKPLSTEWWHFTLRDEPYPDTYFDFNVNSHLE